MTDYSQMSDNQINKLVAGNISFADKLLVGTGQMDYCKNPANAWPIIHDNLISIEFDNDGYDTPRSAWCKTSTPRGDVYYGFEKEPLRAAMIVFLMMKDAENANS